MTEVRCYVCTVVLDGSIYAIGGNNGSERISTVERYMVDGDYWLPVTRLNTPRSDASATVHNGLIYVGGGLNEDAVENSVEFYDPSTEQWTTMEPMINARTSFSLLTYANHLYAIGGNDGYERFAPIPNYMKQ